VRSSRALTRWASLNSHLVYSPDFLFALILLSAEGGLKGLEIMRMSSEDIRLLVEALHNTAGVGGGRSVKATAGAELLDGSRWFDLQRTGIRAIAADIELGIVRSEFERCFGKLSAEATPAGSKPVVTGTGIHATSLVELDVTAQGGHHQLGGLPPFAGTMSQAEAARMFSLPSALGNEPKRDQASDSTLMLPRKFTVEPGGLSEDFYDSLAPLVVPEMSLDDYADLRAQLAFYGEDDKETLKRFSLLDPQAREVLRRRFAEMFRANAGLRETFVAEMNVRLAQLRAAPRSV
jgi:hypothetical protein